MKSFDASLEVTERLSFRQSFGGVLMINRRTFMSTTAAAALIGIHSRATALSLQGQGLPWQPRRADPPRVGGEAPWLFFTPEEGRLVEAIVDRLIPADDLSIGGRDAGCAIFIDRQLAGPFGDASRLYMRGPLQDGTLAQGDQSIISPAMRYRGSLHAINDYCRKTFAGKLFADLPVQQQDDLLAGLEQNKIRLDGPVSGPVFFGLILQNTTEGFFGDPIYGGNKGMVGWKMIGFPGTRYDFRDHVQKHNQPYPLPPVSMLGRSEWQEAR